MEDVGFPPAALALVDEALLLEPFHPDAVEAKRRLEGRLQTCVAAHQQRWITSALSEALHCENQGLPERARELALSVLAVEWDHADALELLGRAQTALGGRHPRHC
jgi:hypothetical protein